MSDRPDRSRDSAEQPQLHPSVDVDRSASRTIAEMDAANARGAVRGLAEIDRGGGPTIGESGDPVRTVPYTVQRGETLWSISAAQQTDNANKPTPQDVAAGVELLLQANPRIHSNAAIREGQNIKIPETIRAGYRQEGREIPGAPTALLLDIFDSKGTTRNVADTSHGGILSAGFNALGFNVIRANLTPGGDMKHTEKSDFTESMARAANYIEANRDKFPPGSFLNTSFGNNKEPGVKDSGDLTFKQLSKMLGMDVNAGNMKEKTDEVLRRLALVSEGRNPVSEEVDAKISKRDREIAGAAVRTNAQIDRIQKMGVEVIHSAGNDGPDRVDINFLRGTQLRADAPHGDKPLKFSGVGSHTEHGAGVIPFHLYDKNTLVADVNGYILRVPVDKSVKFDKRDHVIDYDAMVRGDRHEFRARRRGQQDRFDVEGFTRGYAQRIYDLGPVVDYAPGTSFSPLGYIARTRNVPRPPEP